MTSTVGHRLATTLDLLQNYVWIVIDRADLSVTLEKEGFTTGNICIKWVVTCPREQDHISTTKSHINLSLTDIVEDDFKTKLFIKSDLYCKKYSVQLRKLLGVIITPRCERGLTSACKMFHRNNPSPSVFLQGEENHPGPFNPRPCTPDFITRTCKWGDTTPRVFWNKGS